VIDGMDRERCQDGREQEIRRRTKPCFPDALQRDAAEGGARSDSHQAVCSAVFDEPSPRRAGEQ
jgi:hypothetical protein